MPNNRDLTPYPFTRLPLFRNLTPNGMPQSVRPPLGSNGSTPVETYRFVESRGVVIRTIHRRSGRTIDSEVKIDLAEASFEDPASGFDWAWIRSRKRPTLSGARRYIRLVDLFSGCGGMTLGVEEACRALGLKLKPLLAVDIDKTAMEVYRQNFKVAKVLSSSIESILDSSLGKPLSSAERQLKDELGQVDIVVGGPPCQGHSDLNNHTRRRDSRNALFLKMARFAEVCAPNHIIIENVIGVRHDAENVLETAAEFLQHLGYFVDTGIVRSEVIGVPQTRPRVFLIGSNKAALTIKDVLSHFRTTPRSFMWGCSDLIGQNTTALFDRAPGCLPITQQRIDYLFDNNLYELPNHMRPRCHQNGHNYPSVYGRIKPHEPAPTITTGFMAMGQGRFVHPYERRTLTPHEGARLQCFPDWFHFGELLRARYESLIGNAVPSKLVYVFALELLR